MMSLVMMSLLSHQTGYMFGKGVYFAGEFVTLLVNYVLFIVLFLFTDMASKVRQLYGWCFLTSEWLF